MPEIKRFIPELSPERIGKNLRRFWKIYVHPPKERGVYLNPESFNTISKKQSEEKTKGQPKQVVYNPDTNRAFVSCMDGHALQVFSLDNDELKLDNELEFDDQCVEVLTDDKLVFVTTTNFERPPHLTKNKLWILDSQTLKVISSIDTGGNWSKLMALRPQKDELLVSNWHSHDISIVDIRNPQAPRLKQIVNWGEAPRGIAITETGNEAVVAGFYSGNLGILSRIDGEWKSTYTGEPFDQPNYSGNMRHILLTPDGQSAIVSNLGRNLVHLWDIKGKSFLKPVPVGKSPNSMDYIKGTNLIAVSCRDSSQIYFLDYTRMEIVGKSEKTGKEPTGLCGLDHSLLVTCFKDNTIELHRLSD